MSNCREIIISLSDIGTFSCINQTFTDIESIPIGVVARIIKNLQLFKYVTEFRQVKNNDLRIYHSIDEAISQLGQDKVLIYIACLNLYQVFTNLDAYEKHLSILKTDIEYSNTKVAQIILCNSDNNRKFIVHCRNDDNLISNIRSVVNAKHTLTDCGDFVQLKFDTVVKNRSDERIILQKIISYVSDMSIQLPTIIYTPVNKCGYIECDISKLYATPKNMDELFDIMSEKIKNIENYIVTNKPIHIDNSIVVNNTINVHPVTKPKSDDVKVMVKSWIEANPPNINEGHKSYYDRCKVSLKFTAFSLVKFNNIMKELDYYCPSKNVRPYTWVKD
jgi:predicted regulator of amino acid metabolism with ACT domain